MKASAYYRELLSGRNPSIDLSPAETNEDPYVTVSWHAINISSPIEFVGYHMAAEFGPDGDIEVQLPYWETKGRFWLQTSNTDNFLPYKIVPGSDTGDIDGSNNFEVDIGAFSPNLYDPAVLESDFTLDIMLSNPVRVDLPGFYWIGWAHTSFGGYGGGQFRASRPIGQPRGLMDLHFTGTTPSNGSGVDALSIPEVLNAGNVEIPPATYPNINLWLICQQLTPGVPYGPS